MFIKYLKRQYLAYFLISFAIGGKHLIKSFQKPDVFLYVSVNLFMMFTLAFVLCTLGFCCRMIWGLLGPKLRSRLPARKEIHNESQDQWFLTKDALICFLLSFSLFRYIDNVWVEIAFLIPSIGIYVLYSYWRDKKSSQPPEI